MFARFSTTLLSELLNQIRKFLLSLRGEPVLCLIAELHCTYGKFSLCNTRITARCDIMGDIFAWDRCTVLECGTVREFNSSTMTLLDDQLVALHPNIVAR